MSPAERPKRASSLVQAGCASFLVLSGLALLVAAAALFVAVS